MKLMDFETTRPGAHEPSRSATRITKGAAYQGKLNFWVARPQRVTRTGPSLGIWQGMLDLNGLVWRR